MLGSIAAIGAVIGITVMGFGFIAAPVTDERQILFVLAIFASFGAIGAFVSANAQATERRPQVTDAERRPLPPGHDAHDEASCTAAISMMQKR